MKNFVLLVSLTLSGLSIPDVSADAIHSISPGNGNEPHVIRFESGRVELLKAGQVDKLHRYEQELLKKNDFVHIKSLNRVEEAPFQVTAVSEGELQKIFDRMDSTMRRRSECSDRAHVWAWDEYKKSGTASEKAFIFLTDAYIRKNNFKWWFHVAPMYTTTSGRKMVLDYQFFDRPVTVDEWKNSLVFSKRACVTDFSFLEYNAGADQSQDCYLKFQSMYYRIPVDIGSLEQGTPRDSWLEPEVNDARARAFRGGF